jgi:hypothetical protein
LHNFSLNIIQVQVRAAATALKYFQGLPQLPDGFPIPATRSLDMLDFLHYIFGFQVCNSVIMCCMRLFHLCTSVVFVCFLLIHASKSRNPPMKCQAWRLYACLEAEILFGCLLDLQYP